MLKTRMLRKKANYTTELRLERYWDDYEAAEKYRLIKYQFKKGKLQDAYIWCGGGDKTWARKISKHYGLTVTTPINEDN